MNISNELIKLKAENILGETVISVIPFTNITNNYVYQINTKHKKYILKIYKSGWPEDGKLTFVNRKLNECKISCAKIVYYNHDDGNLQSGLLIEEFLTGNIADKVNLTVEQETELFKKLAVFAGRLHSIKFLKYGYIGNGEPFEDTYSEYVYDAFDDNTESLRTNSLFSGDELSEIKEKLYINLKLCDKLPPVLCHGDLSKKNIMIQDNGEIVLIDYDDVTAIPWICDVARLTLWMKLNYNIEKALYLRNVFMENYPTQEKEIFYTSENALHVWECLGYMNFFAGTEMFDTVKKMFVEAWDNLIK